VTIVNQKRSTEQNYRLSIQICLTCGTGKICPKETGKCEKKPIRNYSLLFPTLSCSLLRHYVHLMSKRDQHIQKKTPNRDRSKTPTYAKFTPFYLIPSCPWLQHYLQYVETRPTLACEKRLTKESFSLTYLIPSYPWLQRCISHTSKRDLHMQKETY